MNDRLIKDTIVQVVNGMPGCCLLELMTAERIISHVVKGQDLMSLLRELIADEELLVINYSLPEKPGKVFQFLFPRGTEILNYEKKEQSVIEKFVKDRDFKVITDPVKEKICIHRAPSWVWWLSYVANTVTPLLICLLLVSVFSLFVLSFVMM